ncbi:S8 family peptidase [Qipengyuania sediminis]|uniref:S8 family peptidase n=1 Tax=Qipengyuania sediminis TaxID=1532023 RepID=UPI00105A3E68|nr:S8 family serine peptidase [Qipengyuania sediminis]
MQRATTSANLLSATALATVLLLAPAPALAQDEAANHASAPETAVEPEVPENQAERPVLAMGGPLAPWGQVAPNQGGVNPLIGRIRVFSGDLAPFIGRIRVFEGDLDPLIGRIRVFEGDLDPYIGNIRVFWGDLTPTAGDLDPAIGRIRVFSDGFVTDSKATLALWGASATTDELAAVAAQLSAMRDRGAAEWGTAVEAQTGKTFAAGFADPFFAKWGVDLARPETLGNWDAYKRQSFLLAWYDNVLNFSGMDRADHWMNAINWSPRLTQTQGGGSQATIGLVDFFVANDPDIRSKVVYSGGYTTVDNAHGAAVGSLIVASHDKKGVMGIAPRALVAAYNPFDASMTASWADVRAGILNVGQRGASVINLSLGVPGITLPGEWRDVFRSSGIDSNKDNTLYVIAAGNDGSTQTRNVEFNGALDSTFIVVGSVDPNREISLFSNRPGTACLTDGGTCKNTQAWNLDNSKFQTTDYLKESGLLMNRFLVAPGEMILVSDGAGGVTRMSGTSFAAPLVSGAIALIQDRWPWLKKHPRDVAKAILESAQDLGAPGVDPIYGHGLLDIEAAQSALDFNDLKYYLFNGSNSKVGEVKVETLLSQGVQPVWSTNNMYFVAFEKLDSAERDFLIPLSGRLFASSVGGRAFQEFMYNRFMAWMTGPRLTQDTVGFTDLYRVAGGGADGAWVMALTGRNALGLDARGRSELTLNTAFALTSPSGNLAISLGIGDGAAQLTGQRYLGMTSDSDPDLGGVNPLLGFASGAAHVSTRIALAEDLALTVGATTRDRTDFRNLALANGDPRHENRYRATALTTRLDYRPARWLDLSASWTELDETGAFLGVSSLEASDFGEGAVTSGLTLAAEAEAGAGIALFASATGSRSRSGGGAMLDIDNALSTAYQIGVAKRGVVGRDDRLRLTLAQPLTLERGHIDMQMVGVIDRETGEKGLITERFEISAPERRRYVGEMLYAAALPEGLGEVNLFGRAELREVRSDLPAWSLGGSVKLAF